MSQTPQRTPQRTPRAHRARTVPGALALLAALLVAPGPGASQGAAERVSFDVYLLGLRAGTLSYAMERAADRYAVTGRIRSSGLVGAVTDFRMDASARGRLGDGTYRPERYTEQSRENDSRTEREIRYGAGGTPQLRSEEKPRDYWVPAARQAGTLDPMTTVYELLRDRPGADPCVLDVTYGDGARIGRVHSRPAAREGDEVTCSGTYERRGGFSRKQLEDGDSFPFELRYRHADGVWRLTRLRMDSVHGRAQLVRR